jgi:hypothetical protein
MTDKSASALRRIGAFSRLDWLYLAIAAKELLIARVYLALRPVEALHIGRRAGVGKNHSSLVSSGNIDLSRLEWAIGAAARRMPWRCDCLPQALAAARWLRRYRLQPRLLIGVAKDPTGELQAHAWLQCNGFTVIGGDTRHFTVLIDPLSQASRELK